LKRKKEEEKQGEMIFFFSKFSMLKEENEKSNF